MTSLRIGDLARLGGVSIRMLRHYHEVGLLVPERVDPATGYRMYDETQLVVLRRIVQLKDLGLPLAQVGDIVHDRLTVEQTRVVVSERRAALASEIAAGEANLVRLTQFLAQLGVNTEPESTTPIDVEVKSVGPRLVAYVSAVAESWAPSDIGPVIQPLYPELVARLNQAGAKISGPSTAWYDDTPDGRVRVHASMTIAERVPGDSVSLGFELFELPAIDQVASTLHRGSMETCDATYQALLRWIDEHGFRPVGYSREIDVQMEPEWITELQFAIEPA